MYQVIKIGDKNVPMLSMASVDIYYRQVFKKDAIKLQASKDFDEGDAVNFLMEMGFIMAKFAEFMGTDPAARRKMAALNEDNFIEWLEGFERDQYLSALPDIRAVYEGQQVTESESKKNEGRPNE